MNNILFIHSSAELYGSDKSLYNLIKGLVGKGKKITVVLPYDGILVDKIKSIDSNINIIIYDFAVMRRKNLNIKGILQFVFSVIASIVGIRKIIGINKIDIVYTNTAVVIPGAIAAKSMGRKSIWHIREVLKKDSLIVSILKKIISIFSDVIITNSIATKNSLAISNDSKIKIVYNAVEPIKIDKNKNKTNIIVGMAGRINRWKGQKLFIDMASKVLDKENVNFVIAGDAYVGEEYLEKELQEYIVSNNLSNNVKLLGRIDNMSSFYSEIDIFILPSIEPEPFGLVVIEAMSAGLPVIATNHGGPCEIITDNIDGFLVDYKNCDEMANVVLDLIKDESKRNYIGQNAILTQENRFSIPKYVETINEIIDTI